METKRHETTYTWWVSYADYLQLKPGKLLSSELFTLNNENVQFQLLLMPRNKAHDGQTFVYLKLHNPRRSVMLSYTLWFKTRDEIEIRTIEKTGNFLIIFVVFLPCRAHYFRFSKAQSEVELQILA